MFIIKDWADNDLSGFHGTFKTFEEAEYHLDVWLCDDYETDRQEYYITEVE